VLSELAPPLIQPRLPLKQGLRLVQFRLTLLANFTLNKAKPQLGFATLTNILGAKIYREGGDFLFLSGTDHQSFAHEESCRFALLFCRRSAKWSRWHRVIGPLRRSHSSCKTTTNPRHLAASDRKDCQICSARDYGSCPGPSPADLPRSVDTNV